MLLNAFSRCVASRLTNRSSRTLAQAWCSFRDGIGGHCYWQSRAPAKGSMGQIRSLDATNVGTFDFEKAVRRGRAQYRLVKKTAQDWFERLVRTLEDEEKRKVVTLRTWHENSPASLDRMLNVTKAYDGAWHTLPTKMVESTLSINVSLYNNNLRSQAEIQHWSYTNKASIALQPRGRSGKLMVVERNRISAGRRLMLRGLQIFGARRLHQYSKTGGG